MIAWCLAFRRSVARKSKKPAPRVWHALKLRGTIVPPILIRVRWVPAGIRRVTSRQGGGERRRVRRVIQPRRFVELLVVCRVKSHPGTQDIVGVPGSSPVQEEESESGKNGESYDTSNDTYHDQRYSNVGQSRVGCRKGVRYVPPAIAPVWILEPPPPLVVETGFVDFITSVDSMITVNSVDEETVVGWFEEILDELTVTGDEVKILDELTVPDVVVEEIERAWSVGSISLLAAFASVGSNPGFCILSVR